jgi:transcriptional regulator with XRE-family HTH domain
VARPVSPKLKRQTETLGQALGAVITALRTAKGWSQDSLALKSGYSLQWINRVERGKANPTMALVIVMSDIFRLRPSQLLARAERKYAKKQPKSPGGDPVAKPGEPKAKAGG